SAAWRAQLQLSRCAACSTFTAQRVSRILLGGVSEPRHCSMAIQCSRRGSETPPTAKLLHFLPCVSCVRWFTSTVPDEPDPPRKVYGFKEREFKRDNAPATGGEA